MLFVNISSDVSNERTQVFYGEEDAMRILLQTMANVKGEAITCSDAQSPAFSMTVEPVKRTCIVFKRKGIRIGQSLKLRKKISHTVKNLCNMLSLDTRWYKR
jgi:hypothetical protein